MADDVLLFIDANQYLPIFNQIEGKKLLNAIEEQRKHVFVTQQVVYEVERNKLHIAAAFFVSQLKIFELKEFAVPDHLLGLSAKDTTGLRKKMQALKDDRKKVKEAFTQLAKDALVSISKSEDETSQRLVPIFSGAVAEESKELELARLRKERGNPPGKPGDPLGDQITWEQLLSRCKRGIKKLWIITEDGDFCSSIDDNVILNPVLKRELDAVSKGIDVFCFDSLLSGLSHFAKNSGLTIKTLPSEKEQEAIHEEELKLPSLIDLFYMGQELSRRESLGLPPYYEPSAITKLWFDQFAPTPPAGEHPTDLGCSPFPSHKS